MDDIFDKNEENEENLFDLEEDYNFQLDYTLKNEMNYLLFEILTYGDSNTLSDFLNGTLYIDINTRNENLDTPLIFCCKKKLVDCTKVLLKHKNILLNCQDSNGDTALHICIRNNLDEITNLLLDDWRIDVNFSNNYNETPFHLVCSNVNLKHITQFLKFRDLSLNTRDIFGYTGLDNLLAKVNTEITTEMELIISNIFEHKNFSINSFKLFDDKLKLLWRSIITFDGIINKIITPIDTLLTFSIRYGIKELFMKCLEVKSTDINLINAKGESPIYLALINHQMDMFYNLLNRDDFKPPPRLFEFIFQYCYCDDSIIQYISIILAKTYDIKTVLNLAIERGNIAVFRYFLETNTNILNEYSEHYCNKALAYSPKIFYYLLNLPQLILAPHFVFNLINLGDPHILKLFLMRYPHYNYNIKSSSNYSPIMAAIKNKHYELIELLKDKCILTPNDILNKDLSESEFVDLYIHKLKVNWCNIFGDTLENMPDSIFKVIVSNYKSSENKLELISTIIPQLDSLNSLEILKSSRNKIKEMDLNLCHNTYDFAYYESFSDMNKLDIVQYGEKIEGKYRSIKAQSLYDITMTSGYGYLRDILDPLDRSKLCNKTCATTGLFIYPDYILRILLKDSTYLSAKQPPSSICAN
jgi:ankyrin repeat protein